MDRLRELADDMAVQGLWGAILDGKEERWNVRYGDGMTVNGLLRAIADQIEADQEERVTRRAEDREAAEWVREHGGLEHLKSSLSAFEMLAEGIEIDTGLVFHDESPKERCVALRNEVKSRPMPEGMGWPRFEDGEPVRIGDDFEDLGQVAGIKFGAGGVTIEGTAGNSDLFITSDERVKRPAPKVLDADGVEIRVGDTVYLLPGDWCGKYPLFCCDAGCELEVLVTRHVDHDVKGVIKCRNKTTEVAWPICYPQPSQLTHRAPVLAADGKPLWDGETAYRLDGGSIVQIDMVFDADCVVCLKPDTGDELGHFEARELTHERPDSWERLEEDVANASCPDVYCANHNIDASDTSYEWAMARDLVRRAKALAGVSGR